MTWRRDPGPCIVCGAAHSACTASGEPEPLTVTLTPARDAAEARARASRAPLRAEIIQTTLPPGQFTTGTYRRTPARDRKGGKS